MSVPATWSICPLEDVVEIHDDLRQPVNAKERSQRDGEYPYYGATGQVGWIDDYLMDGEYILLGEDGAPFLDPAKNKAYRVDGKAWVNNHAHVLRGIAGLLTNRFLLHALNCTDYRDFANGTTRLKLTQGAMRRIPLPIPPLPEQHRIVEKIEELFSDLDAGVASLQRAKANLKRYRASVLKSAVEGRLSEEWRKEHPQSEDGQILLDRILRERREKWERDQLQKFKEKGKEPPKNWESKYEEPSASDTSELPELPEGWVWATVDQVAPPKGGLTKNPNRGSFKRKLPYLRVANVYSNELRLVEMEEIGVEDDELERLLLCKGDLLVVEGNGSKDQIGRVAVWDGSIEPCVHQNHIIKARPAHGMSLWMLYFLISPNGRTSIEKVASSTSGLYTLSISKVASLPVPLPPLAEQEQIVALVEERLSQIDSAEKTIDSELIRSKRLRQSILKRAFEGKLVPQDPKDEPASVLLKRIKASRETEQPKKKAKKGKAK